MCTFTRSGFQWKTAAPEIVLNDPEALIRNAGEESLAERNLAFILNHFHALDCLAPQSGLWLRTKTSGRHG